MRHLVLDTSVIVKWFLAGEVLTEEAKSLLLSHLEGTVTLWLPLLAYIEFGNVLTTQTKIPEEQKESHFTNLFELGLETPGYFFQQAIDALRLAIENDITYYDAVFVATAQASGCELVTADKKLCQKLDSLSFVRFLGSMD